MVHTTTLRGNLRFLGNDYFGGGSGTGAYKTYDFAGGSTNGFISKDNSCPTNWVYNLPTSGGPSNMICDDLIPGGVEGMATSNNMAQFLAATSTPDTEASTSPTRRSWPGRCSPTARRRVSPR